MRRCCIMEVKVKTTFCNHFLTFPTQFIYIFVISLTYLASESSKHFSIHLYHNSCLKQVSVHLVHRHELKSIDCTQYFQSFVVFSTITDQRFPVIQYPMHFISYMLITSPFTPLYCRMQLLLLFSFFNLLLYCSFQVCAHNLSVHSSFHCSVFFKHGLLICNMSSILFLFFVFLCVVYYSLFILNL